MNKIKFFETIDTPPFAEISYDPYDIDSITLAEDEKKGIIDDFFHKRNDVKEIYIASYSSSGEKVACTSYSNPKKKKIAYAFIVEITIPIQRSVYYSIPTARVGLIEYFKKHHNEFEGDEIIEIVNDLVGMGKYQIGKVKYYFKQIEE